MLRTRKFVQQYDLLGCIQCGRCSAGCPIALSSPLNIRRIIYEFLIRDQLDVKQRPEIWDCTTCSTCTLRCPKGLDPAMILVGMRRVLTEEGRVKPTVRDALESTFKFGNPWGRGKAKRSDWAQDLNVKDLTEGAEAEILYYVGCTPAYDDRVQAVAQAMVKVFEKAGVDFGILGNEEICCGSEMRRLGEEGLFEFLVEDNLELFKRHGIKRMVTTSPHCYNTFKNEYEGLDFEVQHYTQFVADLVVRGELAFSGELNKVVTYQDPCFLGKQNGVYDEPRAILHGLPGLQFVDFDRSRERSVCCEGGGGRMWVEAASLTGASSGGERLAETRVKDALELGAEVIATACPFCMLTLEDAVKTTGAEESIEILDIIELVAQAI
ncbi:MAG: (Fe-S)-binding protein [Anaerolineae bacterium]